MRTHSMRRARAAGMLVTALALGTAMIVVPSSAHAAGVAPAAPTLIAPADGGSAAPGSSLSVRANDPDDASLQVSFHAAARGTTPPGAGGAPFTFLVIPDTQNYVLTATNTPLLNAQLQWIVDNRAPLNLAFAAGLGDIVDNRVSDAQWGRVTNSMAILDNAGVPHSVLPGNHDFDLTTGDFTKYNQYFPVSRYRDAAWNSPAASYGGYYGQNQFGPDAADRQNMNNYSLFRAGGMDFLSLSLELNPPDTVLAWAQRVLDAYPDRRVILSTHSYLNVLGSLSAQQLRTDVAGNTGVQMWQKLVRPNCNIFLVVNGHFTDGLDGEASRSDVNDCGDPVYSAVSDFQGRPNGGDGWLRYYTFDPSADTITATTYSPTLNQFETDADSAFTWTYDMAVPAELPVIGQQTVAAGGVAAVPLPDVAPGTIVDWYATVSDGTSVTRGPTWSTTVQAPAATPLAADTFTRTVTAGWGTAETGGAWTVNSTAKLTVAGGVGRISSNAGSTLTATLPAADTASVDLRTALTLDRIPDRALTLTVTPRQVGGAAYGARLTANANGTFSLQAMRDGTVLAGGAVPGITLTAGKKLQIRVQVDGTSPTTIRARAWLDGAPEPSTWTVTATDATAALQQPGAVRLTSYLSSSATNGPVIVSVDDLALTRIGSVPPANQAPTADFTWSANGLTVTADSAASGDTDGTITARTWDFAGTAATGVTASRTFPAAGTYPVTLTVTDDDGATGTVTKNVTVTAPVAGPLARDTFGRTVGAGWGNADTGGAWTVNSTAKLTVAGGVGRVSANAGSTLTATLGGVSSTALDTTVTVSLDRLPNQYLNVSVLPRVVGTTFYGGRVRINPNGSVLVQNVRSDTALTGSSTASGLLVTAGTPLRVRTQVQGTSPTTVRTKVWLEGTAEPATWQVVSTDSTAGMQSAGSPRLTTYLSSSATNGPVIVSYDELTATTIP